MGTFVGHDVPGSFFIIFAVWWTVAIFRRYYQSLLKNGTPYQNTATFHFFCLCGRLKTMELEGVIKIIFSLVGFMGELITGTKKDQFELGNGHHAMMYFFFGMSGVIDMLIHYKVPLPKKMNYAAMTLALLVEACLFKFHLRGQSDLYIVIHKLLFYAICFNIVAVLVEMSLPKSVLAGLGRAYCLFLQGTWFWQVGFSLYNPFPGAWKWDTEDKSGEIMMSPIIFTWHMGGVFIIMLAIGGVVGCVYRCSGEQHMSYSLLQKGSKGHIALDIEDQSDSDV